AELLLSVVPTRVPGWLGAVKVAASITFASGGAAGFRQASHGMRLHRLPCPANCATSLCPRRLAWPRTPAFHAGNVGSNPAGDASQTRVVPSEARNFVFGRYPLIPPVFGEATGTRTGTRI